MTLNTAQHYKSDAFEAIHESAQALHKVGAIDQLALDAFDATCLQNHSTLTSTELSRKPAQALQAAETAPVCISNRGQVTHVLVSIAEYQKLCLQTPCLGDLLACYDGDFDFEQYLPNRKEHVL